MYKFMYSQTNITLKDVKYLEHSSMNMFDSLLAITYRHLPN